MITPTGRRIAGRHEELIRQTTEISRLFGVEMRYLKLKSHRFDVNDETKQAVAQAVVDVQPDKALLLWRHDHHDDHVVASQLSSIALMHAASLVDAPQYRPPRRMYLYDNGPGHTIGFEPDTFVDVSDVWPRALEWLGRFMAVVRGEAFDPSRRDPSQQAKEILAAYRGKMCGAKYCEALKALRPETREIL